MLGRTISFVHKVVWWRNFEVTSQVANPLRSIKFLNFRSLQTVEGNAIRWWKQLVVRKPKGQISVWLETPGLSSLLSISTLRISLCCISLRKISPSRSCSYFTSFSYSYSSPFSFSLLQLSYSLFRFSSSIFPLSRP